MYVDFTQFDHKSFTGTMNQEFFSILTVNKIRNTRVSGLVWYWPDPDPTSQDKPAVNYSTESESKFFNYFMMIFNNKIVAFFIFWGSLVIIFKFSSLLHSFFAPESGGWNRIRIQRNLKTGSRQKHRIRPGPDPKPCLWSH